MGAWWILPQIADFINLEGGQKAKEPGSVTRLFGRAIERYWDRGLLFGRY
jgi:hypothetical protein